MKNDDIGNPPPPITPATAPDHAYTRQRGSTHREGPHRDSQVTPRAVTSPSPDRIAINLRAGEKTGALDLAQQIRTVDAAKQNVAEQRKNLHEMRKIYPPYPPDSPERIEQLQQFNGLQKIIDQLNRALDQTEPMADLPVLEKNASDAEIDHALSSLDDAQQALAQRRETLLSRAEQVQF